MPIPERPPDFVGMVREAALNPKARFLAESMMVESLRKRQPLSFSHGTHLVRASNLSGCSLELLAKKFGKEDLARTDDKQLMLDSGTLWGLWLACLIGGHIEAHPRTLENGFCVGFEVDMEYRGCKGHIDALIIYYEHYSKPPCGYEPLEIKTTPGTGQLKPPDQRKLYQCIQTANYGLDPKFGAERFSVLTWGPNVTKSKSGEQYDKMRVDTFPTEPFRPIVDASIDRLHELDALAVFPAAEDYERFADAEEDYQCASCLFSGCARNTNPSRFAL